MNGGSFSIREKLLLRWLDYRERVGFAVLKFRYAERVSFGKNCKISPSAFRFSGTGSLEIGDGVQIDYGNFPVSFQAGAGSSISVGAGTWIQSGVGPTRLAAAPGAVITVGRGCWFSGGHFGATERITIGNNTLIGWGCSIIDSSLHDMDNETPSKVAAIKIGSYVWAPNYVTVFPGVSIGDHCVIGSGSLVTEDIPPNSFAAGRPAKVIRKIADRDRTR